MELLKANFIQTTTGIVVESNTDTAKYIMVPDVSFQYQSSGFNDDNTTTSIRFNFDETLTVSRIALRGINLREFSMFYNGATASAFSILNGATTASSWSSNSETGLYLQVTPVACTSVTLAMKKTMVANAEKALGYLVLSQEHIDFPTIPAAKDYKPIWDTKDVVHELSDGSTRIQAIASKWQVDVSLQYISESFRNSLKSVFDLHAGMIFVPFGTTTSWDGIIFPCVWLSPFDFYKFSDNAPATGFSGSMKLKETTP